MRLSLSDQKCDLLKLHQIAWSQMYWGKMLETVSFLNVFDYYNKIKGHLWLDTITTHLSDTKKFIKGVRIHFWNSYTVMPIEFGFGYGTFICSVLSIWWVSNSKKKESLKHKQKISIEHMSLLLNDALCRERKGQKKTFERSLFLCILSPLVNCIIKINKV